MADQIAAGHSLKPANNPKHAAGCESCLHGQQTPSFLAQSKGDPEEVRDQEGHEAPA